MARKEAVRELEVYVMETVGYRQFVQFSTNLPPPSFTPLKAVDDKMYSNATECFLAEHERYGWALFDVPWSLITHIKVLNSEKTSETLFFRKSFRFPHSIARVDPLTSILAVLARSCQILTTSWQPWIPWQDSY